MYHPPQQPQEVTTLACLPLAKFSHTTTSSSHRGPLNWSHVFGNGDIIGIFERLSMPAPLPSRVLLKILRDHDILEQVDLTYLTREAESQSQPAPNAPTKPVFAVVVKLPCLAVKYPRGTTCVRRFQIKFSLDRDFYSALCILSDIKCPFSESNVSSMPLARKLTSSQWHPEPIPYALYARDTLSSVSGETRLPTPINTFSPPFLPSIVSNITPAIRSPSLCIPLTNFTDDTITVGSQVHSLKETTTCLRQSTINTSSQDTSNRAASRRSTATVCHDIQDLNQILPPKRDLPFTKPQAKRSRTTASRPSTISRVEDVQKRVSDSNIQPRLNTPAPSPSQIAEKTLNSKMITLKYGPSSLPQLNPNPDPTISQAAALTPSIPIPSISPTATQHPLPPMPQNTSFLMGENPFTRESPRGQKTDLLTETDLSSYLASPTTERTIKLENWICRSIEDDGFLQLCEDVEGIWRRFALGK
ncbi:hypothetical protein BBP40_003001 [Aspergillus hancockii]|nr:hypothetical protein BBP40_003001 [Aspergillus hancockii]